LQFWNKTKVTDNLLFDLVDLCFSFPIPAWNQVGHGIMLLSLGKKVKLSVGIWGLILKWSWTVWIRWRPDRLRYRVVDHLLQGHLSVNCVVGWIPDSGVSFGRLNYGIFCRARMAVVFELPPEDFVFESQLVGFLLVVLWVSLYVIHLFYYLYLTTILYKNLTKSSLNL
jgi:hypothetical protein